MAGSVFVLQLILLLLSTPMYDIDTNSFIRGGFTWDLYHNPFLNLYVGALGKIWPNLWFLIAGQLLFYAFAAAFLIEIVIKQPIFRGLALLLVALEPVTTFYNFSLLSESFFTSFLFWMLSFLILWFREGKGLWAVGSGLMLGLAFVAKLSGVLFLPLLLLIFLRKGADIWQRARAFALALLPFVACYYFVQIGQGMINEGALYTVAGRVRWDLASSQYRPEEVKAAYFQKKVDPYIFQNGELVPHRELRRELSYLGYKDCVADFEGQSGNHNLAVQKCDSIFGEVADQILEQHFSAALGQFIKDNVHFIHKLNYLETRYTPELHFYYPEQEWAYIDSLMATHFHYDLSKNHDKIFSIWKNLGFSNVYLPLLWWLGWLCMIGLGLVLLKKWRAWEAWIFGLMLGIPWVFHLIYISYRPRFLAPYLVILLLATLWQLQFWRGRRT